MSTGVIKKPGRAPTRSEQLLFSRLLQRYSDCDETIIVHHITEDTNCHLQLEVERRWKTLPYDPLSHCCFERIFL